MYCYLVKLYTIYNINTNALFHTTNYECCDTIIINIYLVLVYFVLLIVSSASCSIGMFPAVKMR